MKINVKQENVFFCSDPHYHHKSLVRGVTNWSTSGECRDFDTLEEHDNELVDNINKTVGENDTLFCLGKSFNDDPLRILRAMRFAITKKLDWSDEMWRTLDVFNAEKLRVVSVERIREELFKCFKADTRQTFEFLRTIALSNYPLYLEMLPDNIWLSPTIINNEK